MAFLSRSLRGIGKYDEPKCRRVDSLLDSSDMSASHGTPGLVARPLPRRVQLGLPAGLKWSDHTPYASVVDKAGDFYGDSTAWKYEEKEYRYIIARYSYHQSLGGWQTIDEINGTDGWVSNQSAANAWTHENGRLFSYERPFQASYGSLRSQ